MPKFFKNFGEPSDRSSYRKYRSYRKKFPTTWKTIKIKTFIIDLGANRDQFRDTFPKDKDCSSHALWGSYLGMFAGNIDGIIFILDSKVLRGTRCRVTLDESAVELNRKETIYLLEKWTITF